MDFERYDAARMRYQGRKSTEETFTIFEASGAIRGNFSKKAMRVFHLDIYPGCRLFYAKDTSTILIRPAKNDYDVKFVKRGNYLISLSGFFDQFGIPRPKKTQRYKITADPELDGLIVQL